MRANDYVITIVGLGPGAPEHITKEASRALRLSSSLFIRTEKHPSVKRLLRNKLYKSFDSYYEKFDTFEEVYENITNTLLEERLHGDVVYAVPGHPNVGEKVTKFLQERLQKDELKIVPGLSFLDVIFPLINCDPSNGLFILDALEIEQYKFPMPAPAIIMHLYSRQVASEVKLHLLKTFQPEYVVTVICSAGIKGKERVETIPLYELDRLPYIDHLATLFVPAFVNANNKTSLPQTNETEKLWLELIAIMDRLRDEGGCPWDREQTFKTLEPYLIEEAYEVKDALEEETLDKLPEELGDLLLQIVFLSRIGKEEGLFTINDVVKAITDKLIRRHPHVFGDAEVSNSEEIIQNWEAIKKSEGNNNGASVIDGIPGSLPALHQADLLQKRAASVGFDWPEHNGALEKLKEELEELEAEVTKHSTFIEDEFGDLLFAAVNVARRLNLDSERALRKTIVKFKRRFRHIENKAAIMNRPLSSYTLNEMDAFWNEAKLIERQGFQ